MRNTNKSHDDKKTVVEYKDSLDEWSSLSCFAIVSKPNCNEYDEKKKRHTATKRKKKFVGWRRRRRRRRVCFIACYNYCTSNTGKRQLFSNSIRIKPTIACNSDVFSVRFFVAFSVLGSASFIARNKHETEKRNARKPPKKSTRTTNTHSMHIANCNINGKKRHLKM